MASAPDFRPPIDAGEEEVIGFDFGPALGAGVTISGVISLSCSVRLGFDGAASSRILGAPAIITSKATGAASCAVAVLVGNMIAGVTYLLQCLVETSDGQRLDLFVGFPCQQPQ